MGIFKAKQQKWSAQRRSKFLKKVLYNGSHDDPAQAAHASDTLARKLMTNGEQGHKLNFPNDDTEVLAEKTLSSQYLGVSYDVKFKKWRTQRYSKHEKKMIVNGRYDTEE